MVLLSLLVTALAASGGGRLREASAFRRNAELAAVADGGVQEAAFHLLDASRARWIADGRAYAVRRGGMRLVIRITSEAGRVNPNRASLQLLTALLQACGTEAGQAASIAQNMVVWRSPTGLSPVGGLGLGQPNGGAAAAVPGRDYAPPAAAFQTLDEVGLVGGVTPALLARLRPHLTLWTDDDPDPAFADPVVLQALKLLGEDGGAGSASSLPRLPGLPGLGSAGHLGADPGALAVTVRAEATDTGGHRAVRRAVLQIDPGDAGTADGPAHVMSWDSPDE